VCPTYPYCYYQYHSKGWGVPSHQPQGNHLQLRQSSGPVSRSGNTGEQCFFEDVYCRALPGVNIVATAKALRSGKAIRSGKECHMACLENEDCNYFTYLKHRGNPICYLLSDCSLASRCPSPESCASGYRSCTCPTLEEVPASETENYAQWSCVTSDGENLNPYSVEIPVGSTCTASCAADLEATCMQGGQWGHIGVTSGTSGSLTPPYGKPDDGPLSCGCKSMVVPYNPNEEEGGSTNFVCQGRDAEFFKNGFALTADDQCELFCNEVRVASVYCDESNEWTGSPNLGLWCYKEFTGCAPQGRVSTREGGACDITYA